MTAAAGIVTLAIPGSRGRLFRGTDFVASVQRPGYGQGGDGKTKGVDRLRHLGSGVRKHRSRGPRCRLPGRVARGDFGARRPAHFRRGDDRLPHGTCRSSGAVRYFIGPFLLRQDRCRRSSRGACGGKAESMFQVDDSSRRVGFGTVSRGANWTGYSGSYIFAAVGKANGRRASRVFSCNFATAHRLAWR